MDYGQNAYIPENIGGHNSNVVTYVDQENITSNVFNNLTIVYHRLYGFASDAQ